MQKEKKENMFETYFEWWLKDLKDLGLVKSFVKEPESCLVLKPATLYSSVHYVKKESIKTPHKLFQLSSYTRDYDVVFHKSMLDTFIGLMVRTSDDAYELKELHERSKGDTFYDFSYYYLMNQKEINGDWITVSFDVKPPANALRFSSGLGSSREFPYNQKLMLEKHNIMVNKVIPCKSKDSLFNRTFLPSRYVFTDKKTQIRKLAAYDKTTTVLEWLESINVKPLK